jgi:small subunit ribosomal protein S17
MERGNRKTKVGKVVGDKMDKSVVVGVERLEMHPIYKKFYRKTSRFMAHDEENSAGIGDTVLIMETRPLSRRKRWRLVKILEKAK